MVEVFEGVTESAGGSAAGASSDYAMLFEALPLPSLLVDHHGMIAAANRLAKLEFQLRGHGEVSVLRLLADESKPAFFRAMRQLPRGQSTRVPMLDGRGLEEQQFRPFDVHFIMLGGDEPAGPRGAATLALFVDRSADAARERDARLFQSVLDHAGAAISAIGNDGRLLVANSAFARLLDRSPGERVVGESAADLLGADLAEFESAIARNLGQVAEPEVIELVRHDAGGTRYLATEVFPMFDDRGREFAVGAVITDISELRAKEKQLQLSAEVFARGSEAIMITDEFGRIISTNAAFTELTGYEEAEVLGRAWDFLPSTQHDNGLHRVARALDKTDRWEGELWNRHKNGSVFPHAARISRVRNAKGELTNCVATLSDITARKAAEAEIERMAFYDELTGAATRRLLLDRMNQAIRETHRKPEGFVVLFIDVDHLKQINDSLGHEAGDRVLAEVSRRLHQGVRASDTVARMGGDEFVLLLTGVEKTVVAARARMVHSTLVAEPFSVAGRTLNISASIGVAHFPEDGSDPRALIRNADVAMYRVKSEGRNGWLEFNPLEDAEQQREVELSLGLRGALQGDELWLAYQPIVRLADQRVLGVEVLLRWRNEELGHPKPVEFIELAEDSGIIIPVSDWVMRVALDQARQWRDEGIGPLRIGINVAATHFNRTDLPDMVLGHLRRTDFPAGQLELEITEHAGMRRPELSTGVVGRLVQHGVRMALDDFGTGYSSLSHLRNYPISTIKIDRSFVTGVFTQPDDRTVVESVVSLAKSLGKDCIAEGVETAEQAEYLESLGCPAAQGYFFAPPMDADEFAQWYLDRPGS